MSATLRRTRSGLHSSIELCGDQSGTNPSPELSTDGRVSVSLEPTWTLIERARRAALDRMYPGAAPFISLRKRPVKSKIA
jgi:hypothetical protein